MTVDALSFLASAFYLARIRKPEPQPLPAKQRRSAWHESIEGIQFVLKNPLLAGVIAEQFGVRFTLFTSICGVIAAGLWLLLAPVRLVQASESEAGLRTSV